MHFYKTSETNTHTQEGTETLKQCWNVKRCSFQYAFEESGTALAEGFRCHSEPWKLRHGILCFLQAHLLQWADLMLDSDISIIVGDVMVILSPSYSHHGWSSSTLCLVQPGSRSMTQMGGHLHSCGQWDNAIPELFPLLGDHCHHFSSEFRQISWFWASPFGGFLGVPPVIIRF